MAKQRWGLLSNIDVCFYVLPWFLILDPLGLLQCLFTELHKLQNMSGRPYVTNRISETEGKIREA